jgi:SpoVK/Ycf46/Vps4 family AAA+-type ATPase
MAIDNTVPIHRRRLPEDAPGVADARMLPDDEFRASWEAIFLPDDAKEQLAQGAASSMVLRSKVAFERLPLHGITLLVGEPGVGKTTLSRGLADRVARMLKSLGQFAYVEIDSHRLTSSALGRSQREVETLFSETLGELAAAGPMVVLFDEIETLITSRSRLSFDTNPADVHRAVDAALVGLDRLGRSHHHIVVLGTSNFPEALDQALASRADRVYSVPLPGDEARRAILTDTIKALGDPYPGVLRLLDATCLDKAVKASKGLDGRRLRKAVATACALHDETAIDPGALTEADLLEGLALQAVMP